MTEPLDSILALITDGQIVFLLILTVAVVGYLRATFRYRRMLNEDETSNMIHIAPISVKGDISKWIGPEETALVLRDHLSTITEIFRRTPLEHSSYYMDMALLGVFSQSFDINTVLASPKETNVPKDLVLGAPGFSFPVGAVAHFFAWLVRMVPIRYRNQFMASIIHVSLVSHGYEAQVHVYKGERLSASSPEQQPQGTVPLTRMTPVRVKTKNVRNYEELRDLLWDAAFFILELHEKAFLGRDGRSIHCLADGLYALDDYRRTGKTEKLNQAKEKFSHTDAVETDDPQTLYFYGCLFLADRTQESITMANKLFTRALQVADDRKLKLRALCHIGLASCYGQGIHRLAREKEVFKEKAEKHLRKAIHDWRKTGLRKLHPWIVATSALLDVIDEGRDDTRKGVKEQRFVDSAKMYLKAIKMEPENGTLYNNLGWILLKLAQWEAKPLRPEDGIPSELIGNPAETAEKFFNESLRINNNELTHANLCLLYATPHYRKKDRKKYMERCRFYGKKAIQLNPTYINGHRDLALSLAWYKEFDEAHKYYEGALRHSKDIKKDQEIMHDAEEVLLLADASEAELKRWRNPNLILLSPPDPSLVRPPDG